MTDEVESLQPLTEGRKLEEARRYATLAENIVLTLVKLNLSGHGLVAAASFAAYVQAKDFIVQIAAVYGLFNAALGGSLAIFAAVKITLILETTSQKWFARLSANESSAETKLLDKEVDLLIRKRKFYSWFLYVSGLFLIAPVLGGAFFLLSRIYP